MLLSDYVIYATQTTIYIYIGYTITYIQKSSSIKTINKDKFLNTCVLVLCVKNITTIVVPVSSHNTGVSLEVI